jgi:hypothetical protein
MFWGEICFNGRTRVDPHTCEIYEMELLSYIIYQGTDILPEIFSSSPDTRVFVARKLHEGASQRVILSDKHECWTARKNFWRYKLGKNE